jgi:hypothetical protein
MQGKNVFTPAEVEIIENLLRAKARATRSEQKKIRSKMRDLKFYITDFDQSQAGFTVIDFENLIKSKRIIISDSIASSSTHPKKVLSKDRSEKFNHEQLRESYKPDSIRVLYIAESPPSGGTFFYAMNSNLFRCIKSAFIKVFGEKISDNTSFLKFFVINNFYLEDLCVEPVNDKSDAERIVLRQQGIEPLSQRIKSYSPTAIIILMKGIESEVKDAINKSNLNTKNIFVTTFPSFSQANKDNCITDNEFVLRKLIDLEIIEKINT